MAHTVDKIIKNTDGSLGGIKRKKKKESKKTEQYENPYFGKKKPTSPDLMTWDVTKNYTGKEKKAKGGRAGYKHGGAAKRGQGCEIKS